MSASAPAAPSGSSGTPTHVATPPAVAVRPLWTKPGTEDSELKVDELGRFRVGARVRLKERSGALEPEATGHSAAVAYGPDQEGEVVRFIHHRVPAQDMEYDLVVVRWDAQTWYEWKPAFERMVEGKIYSAEEINQLNQEKGKPITLGAFEAPANPGAIQWVGGTALADAVPAPISHEKPKHTRCEAPLHAVPNSYILFVRESEHTQEIADDLARQFKLKIPRVWPALASFSAELTRAQLELILNDERLSDVQDNCVG